MNPLAPRLGSVCLVAQPRAGRPRCGTRLPPALAPTEARRGVSRRTRLEAVLLLAGEPLTLRRLAQLANLQDATEARTLLEELRRVYDARGCAFQVESLAGGHQLLTRETLAPWLDEISGAGDPAPRLSGPALETLAVVAYRQPVLRVEVEAIRGVQCGELLRQLMERDLLRIVGRSQELGRPLLYGTTKRFLREHGLNSLDELPLAGELCRDKLTNDSVAEEHSATIPLAED